MAWVTVHGSPVSCMVTNYQDEHLLSLCIEKEMSMLLTLKSSKGAFFFPLNLIGKSSEGSIL